MITYYEQIVLMRAQEEVLIFTWSTVGVQPGINCTINGEDGTVPGEIDTYDDTLTDEPPTSTYITRAHPRKMKECV